MIDRLGVGDLQAIHKDMKLQVAHELVNQLEDDGLKSSSVEYTVTKLKAIDFVIGSLIAHISQPEGE
jgi:hypothetical protein